MLRLTMTAVNRGTRSDRAKATRRRIVESAYRLFSEQGYPATTMDAIATVADVAVQTVYYVFRTKAQLLRDVVEFAAAGEHDPPPVMSRPWMAQALAAESGARALAIVVEHGVDIYARVAPLRPAVQVATAQDPEIDAYWRAVTAGRRAGMERLIEHLARHDQLAPGLTPRRAADILVVVNSHETFLGLTQGCGWTVPEFKAWLYRTLCGQLLSDPAPVASRVGSDA